VNKGQRIDTGEASIPAGRSRGTSKQVCPDIVSTYWLLDFLLISLFQPNIDYDVLERHHTKNHRPRPPSPSYLHDVHRGNTRQNYLHVKLKRTCTNNLAEEGFICDDDDLEINTSCTAKRKKSANGIAATIKPTTVKFFPPLWGRLLDRAKAHFRQHLTLEVPFPQREVAVDGTCPEMLSAATVVYWQEQERSVETGIFSHTVYNSLLTTSSRFLSRARKGYGYLGERSNFYFPYYLKHQELCVRSRAAH
jgi:hypothetical protein